MVSLNALSFFVRSSGDPALDGTHAFGCPQLIWQYGAVNGVSLGGLLLAATCTVVWGVALGLFAGHDLARLARWLRLSTPDWPPLTIKTLLLAQLAVALVVMAGVTGLAMQLKEPLIALGPLGAWMVRRAAADRGVPYAGALLLLSALACIVIGAYSSLHGSVMEAVARCFVSWGAQCVLYTAMTRVRARRMTVVDGP